MFTDDSHHFPPGMEPAMIVQSFDAAWNARQVDRLLQFFAPDAVVRFMYPPPYPEPDTYTGQAEIRHLLEGYLSGNFRIQSHDYETAGDMITWSYHMDADRFRELDLEDVSGSAGAVFVDGKIQHLTISFSPDSTAAIVEGLDRAGVGGPISEALAGETEAGETGAAGTEELGAHRPHRGPTWEPAGEEDHQPPPTQLSRTGHREDDEGGAPR